MAKFWAIYYGFSMAVYKGSREMEIDADSIQLLIILIVFELVTTCKLKGKVKDALRALIYKIYFLNNLYKKVKNNWFFIFFTKVVKKFLKWLITKFLKSIH